MSWLSNMFSTKDEPNPADSAMPYFKQIPDVEHAAYDPYIQHGEDAYNKSSPEFNQMASDPTSVISAIMSHYQASPEFKYMNDYLTRGAANTAAAGGIRGSTQDIADEGGITQGLMSKDMQQFLQNVLGIKGAGLQGEQNLYNIGYGASNELGSSLGTNLGNEGQLAFQGQREQNKRKDDLRAALFSGLGSIGGSLFNMFTGGSGSKNGGGNSDLDYSGNF